MSIYEELLSNKQYFRSNKDWKSIDTINLIISEAQRKQRKLGSDPSDKELISAIKGLIKSTTFTRQVVLESEEGADVGAYDKELKHLNSYLPELLSEELTKLLVKEAIDKTGATSMKHIGMIMGYIKKTPNVDMKLANQLIKISL